MYGNAPDQGGKQFVPGTAAMTSESVSEELGPEPPLLPSEKHTGATLSVFVFVERFTLGPPVYACLARYASLLLAIAFAGLGTLHFPLRAQLWLLS
jgi:hypothetical protein